MRSNRIGYLISSGFRGIFSHGLMSFASVTITMACLIIMGSFSLVVVNIDSLIDDLESQNEVVAYVDENLPEDAAKALQAKIEAIENVQDAVFVTRQEAMTDFEADYEAGLFEDLDSTVFRDRYVIHLTDISRMAEAKMALENVDGVVKVRAHLEYAQGFMTVRNIVTIVSLVLIVILVIVCMFIMTNTIKLATFTRREEIAIMKMVGASNPFIRCPFIIEGLLLGLTGGALAFLVQWAIYAPLYAKVMASVSGLLISLVPFSAVALPLLTVYLGVGVLVGSFGGMIAINNYLKV